MKKNVTLLICMFLTLCQLTAQTRTVSGKVTDETGTPLAGATVSAVGGRITTTTTADGNFAINVASGVRQLEVTYVGFATQRVAVGNQNTVSIKLAATNSSLEDVVVVGYGTARKVGTIVGSVVTVNAEKIQDRPTANAFDALQGKVAGLQVFTSNGEPSTISSLRLHGTGSLGANSTPLYVMDGIPVAPATIISLNPNDFESVSVLKDASATSIYGARAANGVIYITTKKGSANKPAAITLQTQYAMSAMANEDFFERFMNSKQLSDFFVASGYQTRAQMDATLAANPNDTRWLDYYYKNQVPMYQADLSISGGGGKTSYFLSGGLLDQAGLAYRSNFRRYTLRSNLNTQPNSWMRMGLNLFFGSDDTQVNPYGSNSTNRGLALLAPPWFSPIDPATGKHYNGIIPGWGRNSPQFLQDKFLNTTNNIQFNPSAFIQITPLKNLTLKTQAGIEAYDTRTSIVNLPSSVPQSSGSASESFARGVSKTITNTGEYKFNVASDHSFAALLGHEFIDDITTTFNGGSSGQSDDRLVQLGQGTSGFAATSTLQEFSYLSYFSRLEYNYRNKYFLDGSFRQDQSSRFGVDNRTANFWAIGAMWRAKQQSFFNRLDWLTDLTVKASYGTSGNSSIGNYQSQALVGTSTTTSLGGTTTNSYANSGGWGISSPGNPQLGWEKQTKLTVGVNFSLYNRARVGVEFYDRVTDDMLVSVPFPFTSGFNSVVSNVGSLKNTGVDITIDGDVLKARNAYVTPYFNLNYNKNKVLELFQGKDYYTTPNTGIFWAVGQPVSYSYPLFHQINPQTGNPEWFLPTSGGKLIETRKDPSAVTSSFNTALLEQNTGINLNAPINGGFGTTAGYNGFFMSADFSFSEGKYMINNDRYFFENPRVFPGFNQFNTVNDFWKAPGDVTRFPRVGVTNWTQFDSRLIEDASFTRLKALTVGYTLPASVIKRSNFITGLKFYVTGRNLLTWTKYTGPDPEVDSNIGLGTNPNTKQVAVGLDLTF